MGHHHGSSKCSSKDIKKAKKKNKKKDKRIGYSSSGSSGSESSDSSDSSDSSGTSGSSGSSGSDSSYRRHGRRKMNESIPRVAKKHGHAESAKGRRDIHNIDSRFSRYINLLEASDPVTRPPLDDKIRKHPAWEGVSAETSARSLSDLFQIDDATWNILIQRDPENVLDFRQTVMQARFSSLNSPKTSVHGSAEVCGASSQDTIVVHGASGKRYRISRFCPHKRHDFNKSVKIALGDNGEDLLVCPRHKWAFNLSAGGIRHDERRDSDSGSCLRVCQMVNDW